MFVDTHTHIYLPELSPEIDQLIARANANGVRQFFLPNIDSSSIDAVFKLANQFPDQCYPMMGLHPCSVNENYEQEINKFVEIISAIPPNFIIHLVPFNIGKNKYENDYILNERIYKKLTPEQKTRVQIKLFTLKELVDTFRSSVYSYGIAMRYHAHILCQTYSIPFISISMTNKTYEYMKDFGIERYLINYNDRQIDLNNFISKLSFVGRFMKSSINPIFSNSGSNL